MSLLEVVNLSHSFGGLRVLDNVSFTIEQGDRVAVIGPNGAGKTTLINIISGVLPCQSGTIRISGHDVTRFASHKRSALGLARSFQINSLFPNLSLMTNVMLGIQGTRAGHLNMVTPFSSYSDTTFAAKSLLEDVGLWSKRESLVANLAHGEQRQVEILLALASQPSILLLDEPSAGLSSAEIKVVVDMIHRLAAQTALLFCAHDMTLVFAVAKRVIVLYYGGIVAEGAAEEIENNPRVREIYLGLGG